MKPFALLVYFCYPSQHSLAESKQTYVAQGRETLKIPTNHAKAHQLFQHAGCHHQFSASSLMVPLLRHFAHKIRPNLNYQPILRDTANRCQSSNGEIPLIYNFLFTHGASNNSNQLLLNSPPFGKTQYSACDLRSENNIEKERKGMG